LHASVRYAMVARLFACQREDKLPCISSSFSLLLAGSLQRSW